jgi:hypothetical protein
MYSCFYDFKIIKHKTYVFTYINLRNENEKFIDYFSFQNFYFSETLKLSLEKSKRINLPHTPKPCVCGIQNFQNQNQKSLILFVSLCCFDSLNYQNTQILISFFT